MATQMIEIARRREQLLAKAELQRHRLAGIVASLDAPIRVVDGGIAAVKFVKSHPMLLAGIATAVVVMRRRKLLGWARRGLAAWRVVRVLRRYGTALI